MPPKKCFWNFPEGIPESGSQLAHSSRRVTAARSRRSTGTRFRPSYHWETRDEDVYESSEQGTSRGTIAFCSRNRVTDTASIFTRNPGIVSHFSRQRKLIVRLRRPCGGLPARVRLQYHTRNSESTHCGSHHAIASGSIYNFPMCGRAFP
ncbi:hypothetical protein METBIDRAFT_193002 [Metschnikowia bicuspidata var. bicuspidata NRRL YB-4993]|uniref:Uncharacterized protein n=1 Tax=Metschnikowia bicuspidata var. bicuspidata NRRL YB-4993 TaxID=869754 RepID=A0A1A0H8B8_9ASCO|nr:hypothetical protein METBIDRAFT_193002 [Metschnikowia bicuspidata var. bicuspidata NRRL YB-4993]OBA20225.1 hypothetical protein METBIDRAFT_193002 [Metschnikowia bicuspidata var. bicuspidata NRRL YB-4993]